MIKSENYHSKNFRCNLCPRKCNVLRNNGQKGFCGLGSGLFVSASVLHHGEEPCFSNDKGVGNFFFTSCNLQCVYCQNFQISIKKKGKEISENDFINDALSFQKIEANFIGLVSPSHQGPWIRSALKKAKDKGLFLPIIYNSSAYDSIDELKKWEGLVDVYLPDLKYASNEISLKYSNVGNYKEISRNVIMEMYNQKGDIQINPETGMAKKGLWVRHLVLPNNLADSWESLCFLSLELSTKIGLSIMAQYEPVYKAKKFPKLARNITEDEYNEVLKMARDLGFEYIVTQNLKSSPKNALPDFNQINPFKGCN